MSENDDILYEDEEKALLEGEPNYDGPTEADLDRCVCWCGCQALTYSEICPDCRHGDHFYAEE